MEAFRQPDFINISQSPLAQITLQVTPDQEDYLEIHEGDNLAEIVDNFCLKWNLAESVKSMLEIEMMRQLGESGISSAIDDSDIHHRRRRSKPKLKKVSCSNMTWSEYLKEESQEEQNSKET